jgi:hypothetical protein
LNNDKAFAVYALLVIGGVFSVLTALVLSGIASVPPLPTLLADVAMGLTVRAGYKWVGGWTWADWSLSGDPIAEPIEVALPTRKAA